MCDKVVCQRKCETKKESVKVVTKLCVKVGEVVCESWCVTKLCAKESVKVVGVQSWCVTKLCVKNGVCKMVVVCVTGGRAGGGGPGGAPGIQNQKQEPHTMLWGITIL